MPLPTVQEWLDLPEVAREHLGYLWKRETLMHYTTFRRMGGRLLRA